jgi:replicative DNA helicase
MENRNDWECLIISCCLTEKEAFLTVSNFLTANNFKDELTKKIFETMCALFPLSPIDIVSVSNSFSVFDKDKIYNIVRQYWLSTSNLKYYSMLILEYDLRVSFQNHLIGLMAKYKADALLKEYASEIESVKKLTNEWCDIFQIIDSAQAYFKSDSAFNMAKQETAIFIEKIDKRILLIKQQSKLDTLFHHLSALDNLPTTNRLLIQKLGIITKHLANGFSMDSDSQNQILRLSIPSL